jgi:hypothetical protein
MAKITDFRCVDGSGNAVPCDAFGNNVALGCPKCGHPILAIILENQRGFSDQNRSVCRSCKFECWVTIAEPNQLLLHSAGH